MNIVQPDYYDAFRCTHSLCEDTCCSGMGVVIDRPTFEKYQRCDDPAIAPLLHLKVLANPHSTSDATFASVTLSNGTCPFLGETKTCAIQETLGEEYLSRTCDTYPRAYSKVDNTLERSLYLSCPEAARVILLRPGGIQFRAPGLGREEKYTDFPTIDTDDQAVPNKPYHQVGHVRNFVMHLLRNRSYLVWERLAILGIYCEELSAIQPKNFDTKTVELTDSFESQIELREFTEELEGVVPNVALLLRVIISSLEDRIGTEYTSPRFLDCYRQFISGIGFSNGIGTEELAANYRAVQETTYSNYFAKREYIWENFLVSKTHKDLFPFGPQKALYRQPRTIYQEYVLLTVQFLFARTLLTGYAGALGENFFDDDVIRLIQSYSRAVEHSLPSLNKTLRSFEHGKIDALPTLTSLLRS